MAKGKAPPFAVKGKGKPPPFAAKSAPPPMPPGGMPMGFNKGGKIAGGKGGQKSFRR